MARRRDPELGRPREGGQLNLLSDRRPSGRTQRGRPSPPGTIVEGKNGLISRSASGGAAIVIVG